MTTTRTLRPGAQHVGVVLGADTVERLERFLSVFEVWNRRLRLTAERHLTAVIDKHVVDCLTPDRYLPSAGVVVDVGSGAGFPGIILACLRPELEVILLESRRRRVSFLREALRMIPLPAARALEIRAETAAVDPTLVGQAAVVVARAIRLDVFLPLATPLLAPGGKVIAMQTPRTAEHAAGAAAATGLILEHRDDYNLPGGAARSLLIFGR